MRSAACATSVTAPASSWRLASTAAVASTRRCSATPALSSAAATPANAWKPRSNRRASSAAWIRSLLISLLHQQRDGDRGRAIAAGDLRAHLERRLADCLDLFAGEAQVVALRVVQRDPVGSVVR